MKTKLRDSNQGYIELHRMNLRSIPLGTLLAVVMLFYAGCPFAPAQHSEFQSLNGTWQFALAKDETSARVFDGFFESAFHAAAFVPIPVPSNWALYGFEEPPYKAVAGEGSQGFYLHHFVAPSSFAGKRVLLHFGGVWSSAEVWLNGKSLGRHDSGFTRFSYDVSAFLHPGADNLLAVRVRTTQHDYLFDTNDDWDLAGIYRDVTLEAMPLERWIDCVDVRTTFDRFYRDADLDVRVLVGDQHKKHIDANGRDAAGEPYGLRVTLKDAAGREVQSQQIEIPAHYATGRQVSVRFHVLNPLHWTAETPNLYRVETVILEAGKPSHERDISVGFRQVSTQGGVLTINGQAVKLRGVDRHDEYPDVGRATTSANWLQDLTLMKAANINFVRTSHYPPAEGFLDLCDKMGMYVEDEVPMGFGGDHANDPSFASAVMLRSYETVTRDINHPAIIIWSIGNEDPLTSLHLASARTVRALDPTRPLLMPWRAEQWLPEEFDILAPHYPNAHGAHYPSEYGMDEFGAISTRPVLATEYNHAWGIDGFGGLEDRWKALTRHPAGAGGAIWMWADQGIEVATRKPDGTLAKTLRVVNDGFDGIVGPYREPQRDYWETKAVYAQTYPSVEKLVFTPGQASVRIPIQNDFDFTNLNAVKIDWVLMEDAKQVAAGFANIDGLPHTMSWLEVPVKSIAQVLPGAAYSIRLTFHRPDGAEIATRAVELAISEPQVPVRSAQKIVVNQAANVNITVGESSYTFNPKTGQLVAAGWKGATLLSDMRPTIWRPLTWIESQIAQRETGHKEFADLNDFVPTASEWKIVQHADRVVIHTSMVCMIGARDRFTADLDYTIDATGKLFIHYSFSPEVELSWIPQVGLTFELGSTMKQLRWLGLGPLDTFPNEKAAGIFGVWSGSLGSNAIEGNKTTRWVEVSGSSSNKVHFENEGYLHTDATRPQQIQLLSSVVGRFTKFGRPDDPEQQLNVTNGRSFVGNLSLEFLP